ncbi:AzlD domain-containing protein [Paenibacillus sp. TRM 82003]|uniref:AzlD domain-containing protein n=1 Tax=Kineococcus sp. TRM81007 TaxID=2925831 RepID=UPI001F5A8D72|nr:AzlD domain-containing protein [Kineococcus sp. TRM81007]MCI2238708.1 AzlD domain-containing protein [Kineococcus sp. TRM81007]MCI3924115.1 AzlD domain-containing protein [Paenibacillus sp. TRM 82003]
MSTWVAVLVAGAIAYALKLAGHLVPARLLEHPRARRAGALLPAALLAALVVVQTASDGDRLAVDARLVGLGVAAVALALRAPFLVVIVAAAASAAGVRALTGWG